MEGTTDLADAWDVWWSDMLQEEFWRLTLTSLNSIHWSFLVRPLLDRGSHSILLPGNGISPLPFAFQKLNKEVTVLDLSAFVIKYLQEHSAEFTANLPQNLFP
jgi:hypothetical protein